MAKPKAARAGRRTRQTKKKTKQTTTASTDSNKFQVPKVEESPDYFPLLELPLELRDEILEYTLTSPTAVGTERAKSGPPSFVVAEIAIVSGKSIDKLKNFPSEPSSRSLDPIRGVLALPHVSKQIREELNGVVSRVAPHRVTARLIGVSYPGTRSYLDYKVLKSLPTAMRRLCLINTPYYGEPAPFENQRLHSFQSPAVFQFKKYLHSCQYLTELVIMLDGPGGWRSLPEDPSGVAKLHEIFISAVESVSRISKYVICTSGRVSCGRKAKAQDWSDPGVIRDVKKGWQSDVVTGEWKEFLRNLGCDSVESRRR